jgi:hypothetical protein
MRLMQAMTAWTDGKFVIDTSNDTWDVTYATGATLPALTLNLKGIPTAGSQATGTLDGTLTGSYTMTGDLTGTVDLDLTITGQITTDANGKVARAPGTTTITGTATDGNGVYMVSLML